MAAKKHPGFEKEIREQVRKDYEAEQQLKKDAEDNLSDDAWTSLQKNGYGKRKYVNGDIYEGAFKDGKAHGKGIVTWHDGT